jgi:glycosyltransferase involved in cell wall biosynthesis
MTALVIATSSTSPTLDAEIRQGKRPRLEYIELCRRLGLTYVDYNPERLHSHKMVRRIEEKLRLDLYWARQLARKIKAEKYDVVLSMSERIGIPLAYMLDRRVKHLVVLHHPLSPAKLQLIKALRTPNRWDLLLPLSHAEANFMQQTFQLKPDQVQVLPAVIDTEFYRPRPKSVTENDQDYILSLGLSNRDYPTLIRALRERPHITCQISATSAWVEHKAGYENEIIPDNVKIMNYDHPNIICDAYARSRFVVIPIRHPISQWSAGSVSVLQPQAMGKPVIATRTPGLADYVLDGETGLLVEPNNPAAMAEAIEYLWNNPEKAALMGRKGQEWVRENFSIERWIKELTLMMDLNKANESLAKVTAN